MAKSFRVGVLRSVGLLFVSLLFSMQDVHARPIYFRIYGEKVFSCDEDTLKCHLTSDSPLRSQLGWPAQVSQSKTSAQKAGRVPKHDKEEVGSLDTEDSSSSSSSSSKIEDGKTAETAIRLNVNKTVFMDYVLDFMNYPKEDPRLLSLPFNNDCATKALNFARFYGFNKLEEHLSQILNYPSLKEQEVKEEMPSNAFSALGKFEKLVGGTFLMGSPVGEPGHQDDEQQHQVTLTPFEVMNAAATQLAYVLAMHDNPSKFKEEKYCLGTHIVLEFDGKKVELCPENGVENISYEDAIRFRDKLNELDKDYVYDLPTEAQQEFYFRGGTDTAYVCGADASRLGDFVAYGENSMGLSGENQTHPVTSKNPNAFGIYRSGLWEWGKDRYEAYYETAPVTDPTGPKAGDARVLRGGPAWGGVAQGGRSACRNFGYRGLCYPYKGVRFVRTRKT